MPVFTSKEPNVPNVPSFLFVCNFLISSAIECVVKAKGWHTSFYLAISTIVGLAAPILTRLSKLYLKKQNSDIKKRKIKKLCTHNCVPTTLFTFIVLCSFMSINIRDQISFRFELDFGKYSRIWFLNNSFEFNTLLQPALSFSVGQWPKGTNYKKCGWDLA